MSAEPRAPRHVRVPTLDRLHAGSRITLVAGPLAVPGAEIGQRRLDEFAALGPAARVGLRPERGSARWRYRPETVAGTVVTAPAPDGPDELLATATCREPVRVTLAGPFLRIEMDHGLGEVQLALFLGLVVLGVIDPGDPLLPARIGSRRARLSVAATRTFGSAPSRLRDVARQVRELDAATGDSPAPGPYAAGPAAEVTMRGARLDAGAVAGLRAWRDAHAPGVSLTTLLICGVSRALRDAGVVLDRRLSVPFDLRRYLPGGLVPLGNFVSGLALEHRPGGSAIALHHQLSEAIRSGRPVAAALRTTAAARALAVRPPRAQAPPPRSAQLLFSGMRRIPEIDAVPWLPEAPWLVTTRITPGSAADITVAALELAGAYQLSASFDPAVHSPDVICAALTAFTAEPIRHLS